MSNRLVRLVACCALATVVLCLIASLAFALQTSRVRNEVLSETNDNLRVKLDSARQELRDARRAYDTVLSQKDYVQKMYDEDKVGAGAYVIRLLDELEEANQIVDNLTGWNSVLWDEVDRLCQMIPEYRKDY